VRAVTAALSPRIRSWWIAVDGIGRRRVFERIEMMMSATCSPVISELLPDAAASMRQRARAIASAGGIDQALAQGLLPNIVSVTVSEGVVLGLLRQGVRKYLGILGHGTTDLGEVLRIYTEEGVTHFYSCRNEVAMAHAATALAWIFHETPAIVTSIGPGALQARLPPLPMGSVSITSMAM
jgi:hypothetical protein